MDITEMPIPEIGPGQVRVEINTAGICGTDVHIYKDEYPYQPPVIMGHEFSGIVDQVSETKKINSMEFLKEKLQLIAHKNYKYIEILLGKQISENIFDSRTYY